MKTIYFHVGSGRCGSTAIQGVFNEPQMTTLLQEKGLRYVPEFYLESGPLTPIHEFDPVIWEPIRNKYFLPMTDAPYSGFFLTQENLMGVSYNANKENTYDKTCELITYLTAGFEVKIIIIIRRQDTLIESLYNQLLKRGELRSFPEYLDDFPKHNFRWDKIVNAYVNIFGRDNITVIPFEKQVISTSGVNDFFCAVTRVLGIERNIDFSTIPTINPSLSPRILELQRHANEILTKEEAHALSDWFEVNIGKLHNSSHDLLTETQRKDIIDYYKESNRSIFEDYISNCNPDYYTTNTH